MRAHTSLRTAFQFGMMAAVAAGVSFASTPARADVSGNDGSPNTSIGTAALHYESDKGLDTSIGFSWSPIDSKNVKVTLGAAIRIDPVKNGGPLYSIDMPKGAVVQASWGTDKKIVLKAANGGSADGIMKVRHTLTPDMYVKLEAFSATAEFDYSANELLNKIPGARFNYDSQAQETFQPWGFTTVNTKLNAPSMEDAQLFSMNFNEIATNLDPQDWDGDFGVRAVTKPTFSYTSTKVALSGANGTITQNGGELTVDAIDGDYMETMASLTGKLDIAGSMDVQPFVTLRKVFGNSVSITVPVTAYSKPYTVPTQEIKFQSVLVHIPLPNVHVPNDGVDLGSVKAGGSAKKTVSIENSGEKAAVMSFSSSDPAFKVTAKEVTVAPGDSYDLAVEFASENAGPALAEITVASNDPDSPTQTFKIGANGADVSPDDEGEGGDLPGTDPGGPSGCGCRTAGGHSSVPGWAGFGLLGLGAVVFVRRRRNAA